MDERKIHDKAVKMRKMTDAQLVEYVENRVENVKNSAMAVKTPVERAGQVILRNNISGRNGPLSVKKSRRRGEPLNLQRNRVTMPTY